MTSAHQWTVSLEPESAGQPVAATVRVIDLTLTCRRLVVRPVSKAQINNTVKPANIRYHTVVQRPVPVHGPRELSALRRRLRLAVVVLLISTAAGFLFSSVSYTVIVLVEKEPVRPKSMLVWIMVRFYVWAILSPLVVLLARRLPITGRRRARSIVIHFAASILFSLVHVALYLPLYRIIDWPDSASFAGSPRQALGAALSSVFPIGVIVYWLILGAAFALEFYRRYGQERLRASRLESELLEAQLEALKMQLQPHFLFNTLHSLSDLVLEDPREATRMIARLGDFLRLTLDDTGSQITPLERELEFLNCYLEIQRVRFQDRLTVGVDIEPRARSIMVPNLILQPLVENAIRHGISRRIGPGRLDISARIIDHRLQIQVRDDGPGLGPDDPAGKQGVGLSNIRERLACLYGDPNALSLQNDPRGGMVATLSLPVSVGRLHAGNGVQV